VGYVGALAHHAVVPPQVDDRAYRPEVGRGENGGQPELLAYGKHARREPLQVHEVDEIGFHLPHVFPRLFGHGIVAVVQLVGPGQALLGATYPANGDALELVVFRLAGQEVAVGDGAFGRQDERLVPAGPQFSRQAERYDLHPRVALGEELVGGEKDPQRRSVGDLVWRSACTTMDYTETWGQFVFGRVRSWAG
jgi:hypothetical protein